MGEFGINVIGAVATALSTLSLMPQVIRTWRTRSAADLSAPWLVLALVSMVVWVTYGAFVHAPAIVWANALTFVQATTILIIKLQSARKPFRGPR